VKAVHEEIKVSPKDDESMDLSFVLLNSSRVAQAMTRVLVHLQNRIFIRILNENQLAKETLSNKF